MDAADTAVRKHDFAFTPYGWVCTACKAPMSITEVKKSHLGVAAGGEHDTKYSAVRNDTACPGMQGEPDALLLAQSLLDTHKPVGDATMHSLIQIVKDLQARVRALEDR